MLDTLTFASNEDDLRRVLSVGHETILRTVRALNFSPDMAFLLCRLYFLMPLDGTHWGFFSPLPPLCSHHGVQWSSTRGGCCVSSRVRRFATSPHSSFLPKHPCKPWAERFPCSSSRTQNIVWYGGGHLAVTVLMLTRDAAGVASVDGSHRAAQGCSE